ncbi:transcriptional regulator FnrL [Paracoccus nototheniae]|uniref:Transcriptional regulator FnrL n=1 Tax=Paracoccus nototheniae TaxID=2489002 RepID=A0ABW4DVY9_9RHOB|nr:Crp/Fnr family transcriptional regulator [Paracoccus nototheniae]
MSLEKFRLTSQNCCDCQIRYRAVCAHCENDELAQLENIKFYRSFEPGQTVVWAGDRMDFVASVVSGVATLNQTMEDGRRQMVGLLLPSDFVGRPGRLTATHDVTAVTDLVLCCFRKAPFERLIRDVPHLGSRLLEMTLDELDASRQWMLVLGRKAAREKIASLLAIVAQRMAALAGDRTPDAGMAGAGMAGGPASGPAEPGLLSFDLPLTREAMADYLGLTLETVSRQMTALKTDGLIRLEGARRIVIPDLPRLVRAAGDDADGGMVDQTR